jgi:kynurenine formamidase
VKLEATIAGKAYRVRLKNAVDCSLPIQPHANAQVAAFSLPAAQSEPFTAGAFVGDVRAGGSVNCEVVSFAPHGNGTHTECIGHITKERIFVDDRMPRTPLICGVVRVAPRAFAESGEEQGGNAAASDQVVDLESLTRALKRLPPSPRANALLLVTGALTPTADPPHFSGKNPTYLTEAAARHLVRRGIEHVLVDLPSLDREDDGGALLAHRAFFGVGEDSAEKREYATVTELCRVPVSLEEGVMLLVLQVAPFALDAAPSRPLLFPLKKKSKSRG